MSPIEIIRDRPISPNLGAGNDAVASAYPLTVRLADGKLACVYRSGATKHSHDGVLVVQTSRDKGSTWSNPIIVFDGTDMDPPQTPISGGICQTPGGTLLASFGCVVGLTPGSYMFSPENADLEKPVFTSSSVDGGENWLPPIRVEFPWSKHIGITARPFVAADGSTKLPLEYRSTAGVQSTALLSSPDSGQTWTEPSIVADDPTGRLSLCDARFEVLADGSIIALLWTFLNENEETVEVHRTLSHDNGNTWSAPEPIGFVSQITAPLQLSSGVLIAAANYRLDPEGIRLWSSSDGGETWLTDDPIQLWDPSVGGVRGTAIQSGMSSDLGRGEGIWDELQRFSFGTPDLVAVGDNEVLHTYYATLEGIIHVRACLFHCEVG